MDFQKKLLKYENKIFEDYLQKRKLFINNIKNIDFNKFNNNQYLNFIADTQMIIDPIKNVSQNIKHFLKNKKTNFENNDSVIYSKELEHIIILYYTYYSYSNNTNHSDSDSDSDSDSELISSNFLDNSSKYSESTESSESSELSDSKDSE